jgi:radical SAM superfamily enzyme YgiQ (UPF0313 family)
MDTTGIPTSVYETVRDFRPDVIGYTMMTGEANYLITLNRKLKQHFDFYTVLGGPHTQFYHKSVEEDGVDAICIGEGDISFPQFLERLDTGKDFWLTETFHVKHEGKIYRNPLGPLVEDLDTLPNPDRQMLYDIDPSIANLGTKHFFTARGCPYRCSYCFNAKYNDNYKGLGKIGRFRSPERVIQEIEWTKERYPLDMLAFMEDVFTLKPHGWIQEFTRLYKKRINLPFYSTTRADNLIEKDLKALAEAGLDYVWMGVETGDEEAADKVFQRDLDNKTILDACKLLRKYGVRIYSLNIMGLPVKDQFEVDMRTLDLNMKIKPALASVGLLYPYPGTPIEEYSIKTGYLDEDIDNAQFLESNKFSSVIKFSSETEKLKVENLQKITGMVVDFPFLRPFVRFLASLPLTSFYHIFYYLHIGYCYKFRLAPASRKKLFQSGGALKSMVQEGPIMFKTFLRLVGYS